MIRSKTATLRIIGGKWRSRKINFVPLLGVRPTTNSIRETLFNWLAPVIVGANCLDLFAGSGALGFEALSRGAKQVVMVDASIRVINQLQENAKLLQADNIDFYLAKIPKRLHKIPKQAFNLVFLDPPFYQDLIQTSCDGLISLGYLAADALIYLEAEKSLDITMVVPASLPIIRKKTVGQVSCYLLRLN